MSIRQHHFLAAVILVITTAVVSGQITVSVTTDRSNYIDYEPIRATVTLKNNSGHLLNFSDSQDNGGFLAFHVQNFRGIAARRADTTLNPVENLILGPGVSKTLTILLTDFFEVNATEDYELTARIGHRRLPSDYISSPVTFHVQTGVIVWENYVGLPGDSLDDSIRSRKCTLRLFHVGSGDIYYLQIEDDGFVYSVYRLGPKVHGVKPHCDIDALSRIHLLLQTAPRLFNYWVFDHNGKLKIRNVYMITQTVPRLLSDPDVGRIMVAGGRVAVNGVDFNRQDDIDEAPIEPIETILPK